MLANTPKLTAAEEKRLGKACRRLDRRLHIAREAASQQLQALEEQFRQRKRAIEARCSEAEQAARTDYREVEDALFDAILAEEERSGVKRDRGPIDMVRWYKAAGALDYDRFPNLPSSGAAPATEDQR